MQHQRPQLSISDVPEETSNRSHGQTSAPGSTRSDHQSSSFTSSTVELPVPSTSLHAVTAPSMHDATTSGVPSGLVAGPPALKHASTVPSSVGGDSAARTSHSLSERSSSSEDHSEEEDTELRGYEKRVHPSDR